MQIENKLPRFTREVGDSLDVQELLNLKYLLTRPFYTVYKILDFVINLSMEYGTFTLDILLSLMTIESELTNILFHVYYLEEETKHKLKYYIKNNNDILYHMMDYVM